MRALRVVAVASAVLCAVLCAVLVGCGPSGADDVDGRPAPTGPASPAGPAATPAPTTAGPTPATTPATPPAATETLVRVSRSGGFAGQTHTLVVKGDGSWTRLDAQAGPEGTGKLSEAELATLRTALREADFAQLPRFATGDPKVYDGFVYAFVHGGFEVAADEEALAPALKKVLDALPGFTAG
ncbi:hypothetical protein [Streptomyces sp. NBC_00162]|uniref:hypothetical protein n=1 Tax=Streptomyces sp. NBC_00162 TaxID=2903629 RepID=UPI00214C8AD2|nr:hypothetical protein [Streptomyces sp. NBC_00162]UUU40013.1 hypothetical protein JIW86_15085 [Streptomyces sp. NBC_00162]